MNKTKPVSPVWGGGEAEKDCPECGKPFPSGHKTEMEDGRERYWCYMDFADVDIFPGGGAAGELQENEHAAPPHPGGGAADASQGHEQIIWETENFPDIPQEYEQADPFKIVRETENFSDIPREILERSFLTEREAAAYRDGYRTGLQEGRGERE